MATRYTVVCEDDLAQRVQALAREYGLTEEEVLRQLVDLGLDELSESEATA